MIVDGHQDIATNVLAGRDVTESVAAIRAREGNRPGMGVCSLTLPDLLQGGVGLVFATLFTMPAHALPDHHPGSASYHAVSYTTPEEARQRALAQLEVYHTLAQRDDVCLVRTGSELQALREHWQTHFDQNTGRAPRLGIVPLMEGGDPILSPEDVAWWQSRDVRIVGPAWKATRYCGGTGQPGPLTQEGRALMRELSRAGIILDTSHMAGQSFWQALDIFEGTVIASHSNCRAFAPASNADRHLSDEMIRALIERDAVIGVVLYNAFLTPDYQKGQPKEQVNLSAVLRHIDHICQLAGNTMHVAIGSDMDGGFGSESMPHELDSAADLPRIAGELLLMGYSEEEVVAIMGENWLRVLEKGLPT